MKKGNVILIIVCILIVTVGIVCMPIAYKYLNNIKLNQKKVNVKEQKKTKEIKEETKITLESEILKELVYPIMHNDVSVKDNYYKMKSINVKSLTNNDILYNAFLQIYNGYLDSSDGTITFSKDYLDSRIKNIFGPKTGYNVTDFIVPSGSFSDYTGKFIYDSNKEIYTLESTNNKNGVIYYDIKKIYEVTNPDDNTINTLFYVAFIKVENGKYTLYDDYNYTNEISSGNFTNFEEVSNMIDKLTKSKYQYTFKKDTCNYDSYCFYEGKWINE